MPETTTTSTWPKPGPRWIPYPNRFWRWRAVFNGWRDGHRGIGRSLPSPDDSVLATRSEALGPSSAYPAQMYSGDINTYETPPFLSRFLQVGGWKVNLVGQQFASANKIYERSRQVEAERIHECAERIKRAEAALLQVQSSPPKEEDLVNIDAVRQRAADALQVHAAAAVEDLEEVNLDDLTPVLKSRAGIRAASAAEAANQQVLRRHEQAVSNAEAELTNWRDNRHAAAQEYVETCAEQAQWYVYMRSRYEALASFTRMIIDLYWAANRRARRTLWRRVAQALFGRWARKPFLSDPATVSPPVESPTWVTEYAYLTDEPLKDPMDRIGETTRDGHA